MKSAFVIFWKILKFFGAWFVLGVASAGLTLDYDIWLFRQWWWYVGLGICSLIWAFSPKIQSVSSGGRKGVIPLDDLSRIAILQEPIGGTVIRLAKVRQSGNEDSILIIRSREEAMREITKIFHRKQVAKVRIWKNELNELDVRINYHHARGTNEGKVIRGATATVVALTDQAQPP